MVETCPISEWSVPRQDSTDGKAAASYPEVPGSNPVVGMKKTILVHGPFSYRTFCTLFMSPFSYQNKSPLTEWSGNWRANNQMPAVFYKSCPLLFQDNPFQLALLELTCTQKPFALTWSTLGKQGLTSCIYTRFDECLTMLKNKSMAL